MRLTWASKVVLSALAFAPAVLSPAVADTLTFGVSLLNTAAKDASESITFVATGATSTLSFQGYQIPGWETVTDAAVQLNGAGGNLFASGWTAGNANSGLAWTFADGSSVRGLNFGNVSATFSDIFSQAVSTVIGDSYTLSFLYSNDPGVSGLLVNLTDAPLPGAPAPGVPGSGITGVPEPSTWALALLGFAALGYAGQNRKLGKVTLAGA